MLKIADSATIRHHMPTLPRIFGDSGRSLCALSMLVAVNEALHLSTRISNPDLPDASSPIRDAGSSLQEFPRSCTQEAAMLWTTLTSKHPKDHYRRCSL